MNVRFQVLGYRDFERKSDSKKMSVITVICDYNQAEVGRGSRGMKATDFFLPDELVGTLSPECLGQEFIPEYSLGSFGKPVLSGFRLEPWKK